MGFLNRNFQCLFVADIYTNFLRFHLNILIFFTKLHDFKRITLQLSNLEGYFVDFRPFNTQLLVQLC